MSRLPEGWAEVELGEVWHESRARVRPDTIARTDYIGLEHVEGGTNRITGAGRSDGVKSTVAVFSEGDILYGRLRPYLNKVIRPPFAGVASTEFLVFKETQALANGLLMRLLSSSDLVAYASANSAGVNLPRISARRLAEYRFRLAPVSEQHRIVTKIESLFAKLDEGVAALKRAEANLERYRASVLKSAVEGRLTVQWRWENPPEETGEELLRRIMAERRKRWEAEQLAKFAAKGRKPPKNWKAKYKEPVRPDTTGLPGLPEGWCWATVDQVAASMRNGRSVRSRVGGFPVLRLSAITGGALDDHDSKDGDWESEEAEPFRVRPSDFFVSRGNGSLDLVGRGSFASNGTRQVAFPDTMIRLDFVSERLVNVRFVAAAWNSQLIRGQIVGSARTSAGIYKINQQDLRHIHLPIPPAKEQARIVHSLWTSEVAQSRHLDRVKYSIRTASALRQSILKRAFEGGLVPQDPADEPASVLLERIRGERQANRERNNRRRAKSRRHLKSRAP